MISKKVGKMGVRKAGLVFASARKQKCKQRRLLRGILLQMCRDLGTHLTCRSFCRGRPHYQPCMVLQALCSWKVWGRGWVDIGGWGAGDGGRYGEGMGGHTADQNFLDCPNYVCDQSLYRSTARLIEQP